MLAVICGPGIKHLLCTLVLVLAVEHAHRCLLLQHTAINSELAQLGRTPMSISKLLLLNPPQAAVFTSSLTILKNADAPVPPSLLRWAEQQQHNQQAAAQVTLPELVQEARLFAEWCSTEGRCTATTSPFPQPSLSALPNIIAPYHAFNSLCSPDMEKALRVRGVLGRLGLGVKHGGNKRPLHGFFELLAQQQVRLLPCVCDRLYVYVSGKLASCRAIGLLDKLESLQ